MLGLVHEVLCQGIPTKFGYVMQMPEDMTTGPLERRGWIHDARHVQGFSPFA